MRACIHTKHYRWFVILTFLLCCTQLISSEQLAFPNSADFMQASKPEATVLIEAEAFDNTGGWTVDQQYMNVMGSPVLLAHGMGVPVADASTKIALPETGKYRVFVRTRNWVAPWTQEYAPGTFQLSINNKRLDTIFGTGTSDWRWQFGGVVTIDAKTAKLTLHDLTGFDGRLDAIILTKTKDFVPPDDVRAIDLLRRRSGGLPENPADAPEAAEGPFDLVVVGGGITGICTAISAARLGSKVALIQDRPLLGGNNSSEVRVHLRGRINYPPYPNIGNLVHELDPIQYGNGQIAEVYKDELKLKKVQEEKNIALYLNTHVILSETVRDGNGSTIIRTVIGKNVRTGSETKFVGRFFVDCTGDANLGFMAGADWRLGREAKRETGEYLAPENPDNMVLGASILWYSDLVRDEKGDLVKTTFPELPWAHQFNGESAQLLIRGEWDWETGFFNDPVQEAERVRDNGLRAVYGHWAYMKNHSPSDWQDYVQHRKLGWVSFLAGKRESRRLMGDVVLKEQDILSYRDWPDVCVVGTWPIDLHSPAPDDKKYYSGDEFRSISANVDIKPFKIPYRTLYSRNIDNLFMAGRNISVTHVALGATRVMRTCGMMGEVVGMAAAVAKKHDCTPRDVYEKHLDDLIQLMKQGVGPKPEEYERSAKPPGYQQPDLLPKWAVNAKKNLALEARVSVSSSHRDGKHPSSFINDGHFDVKSNEGRWISDMESNLFDSPHWVEFSFDKPVEINAYRVLSGQAPPNKQPSTVESPRVITGRYQDEETPMYSFVLQRKTGNQWIDIEGSEVIGNESVDVWRRFDTVQSNIYRLKITETRQFRARLWELEFYKIED